MKTFKKSFIKKKPLRKASTKAQSAMEYLMTYGWAILIVAVVLGALYSLGVFNGSAFLGTSCIAASGFYCTNPILSTGGVLTVTIGQATGTTFENAYLYFVPSGTSFSTSDPSTSIGTLNSGQQVTVSIPLTAGSPYPAAYTLGTPLSGYLYLQFTDIYGTTEVNKIATVLTKVTTTSSGGATFSQSTPEPSGIVAYVPITLTNSQSSATPSPFQQMIQINEGNYANYITYNGNIANFEFYTQSGQILPAWIESNNSGTLTVWVNLPNGIPASSSLTIYLGFASKTTNLLSSSGTSGIGEAPQLSSTYAQYDDGASVFNVYQNFAGSSCPSGWICQSGATIDNGVTLNGADINSTSAYSPQILDAYVVSTSGNAKGEAIEYFTNSENNAFNTNQPYWGHGNIGSTVNGNTNVNANPPDFTGPYIQSLGWNGSTLYWWANYTNEYTEGTSLSSSSQYYLQIAAWPSGAPAVIQWVRTRAYPPNGVMPSVSFVGLSSA